MNIKEAYDLLSRWIQAKDRARLFAEIGQKVGNVGLLAQERTPAGDVWQTANDLAMQFHREAEALEKEIVTAMTSGERTTT